MTTLALFLLLWCGVSLIAIAVVIGPRRGSPPACTCAKRDGRLVCLICWVAARRRVGAVKRGAAW